MDGCPDKGEVIPIRMYMNGIELAPSYENIHNRLTVKYWINLVLLDEDDRRYFKQTEITIYRKPWFPFCLTLLLIFWSFYRIFFLLIKFINWFWIFYSINDKKMKEVKYGLLINRIFWFYNFTLFAFGNESNAISRISVNNLSQKL